MAVDLCFTCHVTSIQCSHVSADGFEVENLISLDATKKRNGFRAEYFIKPPVEITVTFVEPIRISQITLGLKIGAQKTNGIELWSSPSKGHDFQRISRIMNICSDEICVKNPRCKLQKSSNTDIRDVLSWRLHRIERLKVRLVSTANSSVPVLSLLNLNGYSSRNCKCSRIQSDTISHQIKVSTQDHCAEKCDIEVLKESDIPKEFFDPITCNIMSSPVLLPCGKTIDQDTLDKHTENQAHYGFPPGDPFTGVAFSKNQHPFRNSALKARIDQFLLSHQHINIPRSLSWEDKREVSTLQDFKKNETTLNYFESSQKMGSERVGTKRSNESLSSDQKKQSHRNDHEKHLAESLNEAVSSVLGNLKTFCKDKDTISVCCTNNFDSIYKLPCCHHMCRNCIKKSGSDVICCFCSKVCKSSEIIRAHIQYVK